MDMQHMSIGEIEAVLVSEGLGACSMGSRDIRESQSARMGEDGEYDIADYMESDSSPEAQAIIEQLQEMGLEFLAEEYGMADTEEEPEPEPEPAAPWAWLKRK